MRFLLSPTRSPQQSGEISCDTPDALQHALRSAPAGGRIIIRAGVCTGNFALSRDIRVQGSGLDQVTLKAADPAQPVVTVPRGITATISGVTIKGGTVQEFATGIALDASDGNRLRDTTIRASGGRGV